MCASVCVCGRENESFVSWSRLIGHGCGGTNPGVGFDPITPCARSHARTHARCAAPSKPHPLQAQKTWTQALDRVSRKVHERQEGSLTCLFLSVSHVSHLPRAFGLIAPLSKFWRLNHESHTQTGGEKIPFLFSMALFHLSSTSRQTPKPYNDDLSNYHCQVKEKCSEKSEGKFALAERD